MGASASVAAALQEDLEDVEVQRLRRILQQVETEASAEDSELLTLKGEGDGFGGDSKDELAPQTPTRLDARPDDEGLKRPQEQAVLSPSRRLPAWKARFPASSQSLGSLRRMGSAVLVELLAAGFLEGCDLARAHSASRGMSSACDEAATFRAADLLWAHNKALANEAGLREGDLGWPEDEHLAALVRDERFKELAKLLSVTVKPVQRDIEALFRPGTHLASLHQLESELPQDRTRLVLRVVQCFRRAVSLGSPPISEVVSAGIIPALLRYLELSEHAELQLESAWVLTNIAGGDTEHTAAVVDAGSLPVLARQLRCCEGELLVQVIWTLGNIAGDGPRHRDLVLDHDILRPLLSTVTEILKTGETATDRQLNGLRNATWTISNLLRGSPAPAVERVQPAFAVLVDLLHHHDLEVLQDACWAWSYASNEHPDEVLASGALDRLVELLGHSDVVLLRSCLKIIGNIVAGDDEQTQRVVEAGALPYLLKLLRSEHRTILKESCWVLSNIAAGNSAQIQALLDAGFCRVLIPILEQTTETEVQKEAAWALSNSTAGSDHQQISDLIDQGCVAPLCCLLNAEDDRIVAVALEGLENLALKGVGLHSEDAHPSSLPSHDAGSQPAAPSAEPRANPTDLAAAEAAVDPEPFASTRPTASPRSHSGPTEAEPNHDQRCKLMGKRKLSRAETERSCKAVCDAFRPGVHEIERLADHPNQDIQKRAGLILEMYTFASLAASAASCKRSAPGNLSAHAASATAPRRPRGSSRRRFSSLR